MTADATLPVDHQHRVDALDPRRSICVSAPAGSGKTELLTQRVLRLLACVGQPEEILAITFTRKAAAEMHHRVMQALTGAATGEAPRDAHKQLSWQLACAALARDADREWGLLDNPGRLKVQTIDSLCAALTRQMPVLSNFGTQPQIADDGGPGYRLAITRFLQRLEGDGAVAEAIAALLAHVDTDVARLERLLVSMLQRRDQWLLHLGSGDDLVGARSLLEDTLSTVNEETLAVIAHRLAPYAGDLVPLLDYAAAEVAHCNPQSSLTRLLGIEALPPANVDALRDWRAIVELLLVKPPKRQFRRALNKNSGFPPQTHDGDRARAAERKRDMEALLAAMAEDDSLLSALAELFWLPDNTFPPGQWQILEALLRVLPVLVAELMLVYQQHGVVDHTQVALAALHSLGDGLAPTELALKLDYRLRHILVDEFQDTSSLQFGLLQKLMEGWAEHNAADPDNPHTLFLVGDGMQSIYGFRNANVGLFLEARHFGVNGVTLDDRPLRVNFRSDPAVVEWINRVFVAAFPAEENLARGAVPYELSVAHRTAGDDAAITVAGYVGDDAQDREAAAIVDLIAGLSERQPGQSIAVLVRNRSHLRPLIRALGERGMRWNASDIDSLADYACIRDLLSLTRALFNLADRVSWAALLRTPWFGLDHNDLLALLGNTGDCAVWSVLRDWSGVEQALSAFARLRLARQVPRLAQALAQRQRFTARQWIEGLWLALGGPAGLRDPRELDMVDAFFDTLETYPVGLEAGAMGEFESAVQQLYASPPPTDSNLHLMTIHKSKGLEFDTVILPGLARKPRSDDRDLLMWREYLYRDGAGSGLVISPLPATGADDSIYRYLRNEQALSQRLENTRLLYVAATRAVRRLHLSFATAVDERSEAPKAPPANSLLDCIWEPVRDTVRWNDAAVDPAGQLGFEFDRSVAPVPGLARLDERWRAPEWSFSNPLAAFYLNADFGDDNRPEPPDPVATGVGNVVHTLFETLKARGLSLWLELAPEQQMLWAGRLLQAQALAPTQIERAQEAVLQAVNNTVNDGRGRWLLGGCAREDYAELAVSGVQGGAVRHRVVDRVLRDEQGNLWIVDYKTAVPAGDETRQQFVAREIERYRGQLKDYRWFLSQLTDAEPIKLALYFTAIPLFQEL